MFWFFAAPVGAFFVAALGAGIYFQGPKYQGEPSAHFDGKRFFNLPGGVRTDQSVLGILKFMPQWLMRHRYGTWEDRRGSPPGPKPVERVAGDEMRMTWINHATVLVQMGGRNILTDPIWSDRCSPVQFAGPQRKRDPGIAFSDLPPIDYVLISHNHYDHLDKDTLLELNRVHGPRFFVPLGNGPLLQAWGIEDVVEMDWWGEESLGGGLRLYCTPAQHFSSRGLGDRNRTLWASFFVSSETGGMFFGGDTGYGPHFVEIKARLGAPRLAILPAGAYRPRAFMAPVHMGPEEAVQAHDDLGAGTSQIIHFGTFNLGLDGMDEAGRRVKELSAGSNRRFWIGPEGEVKSVPGLSD